MVLYSLRSRIVRSQYYRIETSSLSSFLVAVVSTVSAGGQGHGSQGSAGCHVKVVFTPLFQCHPHVHVSLATKPAQTNKQTNEQNK